MKLKCVLYLIPHKRVLSSMVDTIYRLYSTAGFNKISAPDQTLTRLSNVPIKRVKIFQNVWNFLELTVNLKDAAFTV